MIKKSLIITILIVAAVTVMVTPIINKPGYAATTYRLHVINNSNAFENFAVYQNDPDLGVSNLGSNNNATQNGVGATGPGTSTTEGTYEHALTNDVHSLVNAEEQIAIHDVMTGITNIMPDS